MNVLKELRGFKVKSLYGTEREPYIKTKGFHRCGLCKMCKICPGQRKVETVEIKGKNYKIRDFITCHTKNVIYFFECKCKKIYVGKTTRPLKIRLNEHILNIRKGKIDHSVPQHFKIAHNCSAESIIRFMGLQAIQSHWRSNNITTNLAKSEMKWIYQLKSLVPNGLNTDFELKWFLT